jgi:tetratricopeptide (TPR) repeat protein
MNQNKFQEAESHFLKSLENDPSYTNALYQSGANYFAWANEIIKTANLLPFNDPKFPKMDAEAKEIQKKALIPLEKYIDTDPNDKNILDILYKTHRKLGNTEKALSYKARYDALK